MKNIKSNKSLFYAVLTKGNQQQKKDLWSTISKDVNSVGTAVRSTEKIQKAWADWVYSVRKKKKKLSDIDNQLVSFLDEDISKDSTQKNSFNKEELKTITDLVTQNYKTLMGAHSNKITQDMKYKLWQNIASTVNSVRGKDHTIESIQRKWSKMVSQVKMKCAKINREGRKTGIHEPSDDNELDQQEEMIKNTIGDTAIKGVDGGIDMDLDSDEENEVDNTMAPGPSNADANSDSVHDIMQDKASDEDAVIYLHVVGKDGKASEVNTSDNTSPPKAKKHCHKRRQSCQDDTGDTKTLIDIERRKIQIMEEQLEINRQRLKVEESISEKLDLISQSLNPFQIH